jgi:hypothetical protein
MIETQECAEILDSYSSDCEDHLLGCNAMWSGKSQK